MLTLTYNEMDAKQRQQLRKFGCLESEMREAVERRMKQQLHLGPVEYAVRLLQDASETLNIADNAMLVMDAQQEINRAIWVLSHYKT